MDVSLGLNSMIRQNHPCRMDSKESQFKNYWLLYSECKKAKLTL